MIKDREVSSSTRIEYWDAVCSVKKLLEPLGVTYVGMHKHGYIEVDWGSIKTFRTAIDTFPIPLTYKISDNEILQVRHTY